MHVRLYVCRTIPTLTNHNNYFFLIIHIFTFCVINNGALAFIWHGIVEEGL